MIAFNSTTQVCRLKLGIGSGKNGLTRELVEKSRQILGNPWNEIICSFVFTRASTFSKHFFMLSHSDSVKN